MKTGSSLGLKGPKLVSSFCNHFALMSVLAGGLEGFGSLRFYHVLCANHWIKRFIVILMYSPQFFCKLVFNPYFPDEEASSKRLNNSK